MFKVVNKRNLSNEIGWIDIVIDRSSVLGNPFELLDEADRDKVCNAYVVFAWHAIWLGKEFDLFDYAKKNGLVISKKFKDDREKARNLINQMIEGVQKGNKYRLICWCFPKRCHGMELVKMLNYILENS